MTYARDLLYEPLADLNEMFSRAAPEQPFSRPLNWLILVLD